MRRRSAWMRSHLNPALRSTAMRPRHIPSLLAVCMLACVATAAEAPSRVERGNLIYDGMPAEALVAPASLARWQESRGANLLGWLADGSVLASMRVGDSAQLHRAARALAAPEVLTRDVEPVTSATAHPFDA